MEEALRKSVCNHFLLQSTVCVAQSMCKCGCVAFQATAEMDPEFGLDMELGSVPVNRQLRQGRTWNGLV